MALADRERRPLHLRPTEHRNRYRVGKFTPAELGKSSPVLTRVRGFEVMEGTQYGQTWDVKVS